MNLLEKAMRLKAQRLKAKLQPQAGRQSRSPSAIKTPAPQKPSANPISPWLLITGGIGFVLGAAAIGILFNPVKSVIIPALPMQKAASPTDSSQLPPVAASQNKANDGRQKVSAIVSDWAKAWAAKDADNYLSFYAPEFRPPHGLARSAWEKQRRNRLSRYRKIEIELSGLTVSLEKDTATVEFVQSFKADGFSETGLPKRLDLKLHGTRWMIVKETSGKE
ncbi:MAG: hypothetical protein Q7T21_16040 [Gallionella sp.]|nr:hypothetical protein [Gallionella sp.]